MNAFVHHASRPLTGLIDPPSSKNYTTRYILASCLASGTSIVRKPAVQDDAVALVRCCRQFGAFIDAFDADSRPLDFSIANAARIDHLRIEGFGDSPQTPKAPVDPANAGTVLRLLLGVAALCDGPVHFETAHHKESLGTRPNRDLVEALRVIGVKVEAAGEKAALPITIHGGKQRLREAFNAGPRPFYVPVSGAVSSQFVSSLLFLAPLLNEEIEIRVTNDLKSRPLVETTCAVLADAGITVQRRDIRELPVLRVSAGSHYRARTWTVNGDWPGSAAILGAAAVVPHSHISIRRLREDEQGERRCVDFYRDMGCRIETAELDGEQVLHLHAPSQLTSAAIDGDLCTDAVLAMMGAACLAAGESRFDGIYNLQFKECDRVREPITELLPVFESGRASASWEPDNHPQVIRVLGAPEGFPGGLHVDGRGDHRVIMMLSIVGLRCRDGLIIRGAEHVAKSFPAWFDTLRTMGAQVDLV